MANRARLSRAEGRARVRPLRRPILSWMASSCDRRPLLLRVRRRRTIAAFPPLGARGPRSCAPARGLNVTSRIPSPPFGSRSHDSSPTGFRAVPSAIEPISHRMFMHAQRKKRGSSVKLCVDLEHLLRTGSPPTEQELRGLGHSLSALLAAVRTLNVQHTLGV